MADEGGGFGGRAEDPEEAALARQVAPLGGGLNAILVGGGGFRWTLGTVGRSVHLSEGDEYSTVQYWLTFRTLHAQHFYILERVIIRCVWDYNLVNIKYNFKSQKIDHLRIVLLKNCNLKT